MIRFWLKLLLGFGAVLGLMSLILGRDPDFTVEFDRAVPSERKAEVLGKAIDDLSLWPSWHHELKSVTRIDGAGREFPTRDQKLERGALLRFSIEPPTKQWRRFDLTGEVVDYAPGKGVRVRLIEDSTTKIAKLLKSLEWSVEIERRTEGVYVHGRARGETLSRKGRVFARLSPRILMNQVYYPDLIKLTEIEIPQTTTPPTSQ